MKVNRTEESGRVMKIKEVEHLVGISSANIRYYEKEGLITPIRIKENNYREYTEKDVHTLNRIKTLRLLGIPIADIRQMEEGNLSVDEAVKRRLSSIEEEARGLKQAKAVCESILDRDLSYEAIDENLIYADTEQDQRIWKERLEEILAEDITKEILTKKQLNKNVSLMLIYGYLINIVVSVLFGNWFLNYKGTGLGGLSVYGIIHGASYNGWNIWSDKPVNLQGTIYVRENSGYIFFTCLVIAIFTYIGVYLTSSIKLHVVFFHLFSLILTPMIGMVYQLACSLSLRTTFAAEISNTKISGLVLATFWLLITVYILILWKVSVKREGTGLKVRHILLMAAVFIGITIVLAGVLTGAWISGAIISLIFSLYLGMCYYHLNQEGTERSRYYAITTAGRIMNIFGMAFNMRGKSYGPLVYR